MPGGRPTKYCELIQHKADKYLNVYEQLGEPFPSLAGLSQYIRIKRSTIYLWGAQKNKSEFSDTLDEIKNLQELQLIIGGSSGKINMAMAKLILINHGYHDKQDSTSNSSDGSGFTTDVYITPASTLAKDGADVLGVQKG